ncbi:hypothetical protein ABZ357_20190 [Streptomyces sp. NPDC005917]|uniref:hypothetical protein n=1 Tax=unclassified Streptomyces TaxID=2593676 RepID=UPI0033F834C9
MADAVLQRPYADMWTQRSALLTDQALAALADRDPAAAEDLAHRPQSPHFTNDTRSWALPSRPESTPATGDQVEDLAGSLTAPHLAYFSRSRYPAERRRQVCPRSGAESPTA